MAKEYVDLDALMTLAAGAPDLDVHPWDAMDEVAEGSEISRARAAGLAVTAESTAVSDGHLSAPRIAVAGGAAFSFGYAETSELLVAAGAQVVGFDPLRDEALPAGVSGLLMGGGFPQIHASDLAANAPMRRSIKQFADDGGAISAECAGLLYLGRELDGAPMCGVLPITSRMGPRLTLGYRSAVALSDNVLCSEGHRVNGHEFHRTQVVPDADSDASPAWAWKDNQGSPVREGLVRGAVHASYLHVHWAGQPAMATRLVARAAQVA
jgi:cobyrinic acid a,c-diamide synthase